MNFAQKLWKSLVTRVSASPYATSTSSKLRSAYAPSTEGPSASKRAKRHGDFVPVYVAIGMIMLAGSIGIHTAMQQIVRSPAVRVKKTRRVSFPEVEEPDHVVEESQKFLDKSFFRKVAHIQEFNSGDTLVPDTIRKDVYGRKHSVETLKSVGIDPSRQS